jgi:trehalose-6-phosphate synthase
MTPEIDGIKQAIWEEREACAKLLEGMASEIEKEPLSSWNNHFQDDCYREAAQAIRARGEK